MTSDLSLEEVCNVTNAILAMDATNYDPETAHVDQDDLWQRVLMAVVAGHPDVREMARECLRLADSEGTRWYA